MTQGDRKEKRMLSLKRLVSVLALGLSTATFASPAAADGPTRVSFEYKGPVGEFPGWCAFPLVYAVDLRATGQIFFDKSQALTRIQFHVNQTDTFTANGKTLVSEPYTFNIQQLFDSNGNQTHFYVSGIVENIRLPDGSLFKPAGRKDFQTLLGGGFFLAPDVGNASNLAAFCAALAP